MPDDAIAGAGPAIEFDAAEQAFLKRFLKLLPGDVAKTLNDAQLRAITAAFGARSWQQHRYDLRMTIPFLGRYYYFVLLSGRERRSRERRGSDRTMNPIATVGNAIFGLFFFGSLAVSAFAALYLLKSVLGIDLNTGYSLGLYGAISDQFGLFFR